MEAYAARYLAILTFTERNIWDKWYSRGQTNIYRIRTHMSSHWAYIALNLERLTASPIRAAQCRCNGHVYGGQLFQRRAGSACPFLGVRDGEHAAPAILAPGLGSGRRRPLAPPVR
jgi:hypothetical protein